MFIEDPEGFKTWLTSKLEPLCEADPAALAKYVYALVKKDKPVEELKTSMVDQLEVFLQKETKGFVDLLFKTLEAGDFEVKTTVSNESNPAPPSATTTTGKPPLEDIDLRKVIPSVQPVQVTPTPPEIVKKEPPVKEPVGVVSAVADSQSLGSLLAARKENNIERHPKKSESDKDERGRGPRGRPRRGMSMSPVDRGGSRRSRSYERRRSRSRDRDRSRAWRNKSPPLRARYADRRRSYSKSPPPRRHSRSRSPPLKRGRYRNRSPPPRSLTRSPTPSRNSHDREMKSLMRESDTDLRLGSSGQNLSSVINVANSDQPFPAKRCRDFDEKGFCMRGDLCPFDHGSDPVVLEDIPGSVMYNGAGSVDPRSSGPLSMHHPHESPSSLEYNPAAPSMEPRLWRRYYRPGAIRGRGGLIPGGGGPIPLGNNMESGVFPKRELISVITGSPLPGRGDGLTPPYRASLPPGRDMVGGKRYEPYSRLGSMRRTAGGITGPVLPLTTAPTNNTLQLKKVPPQNNNITHLNDHFSKFGKIVNILVGFEGDAESALITFSSYMEANNAYKSTEPILNNRFIKVFWYTANNNSTINNNNNALENKQENMAPGGMGRPSVLERLGAPNNKVLNSLQPTNVAQQQEARVTHRVTMSNNNISKTIYVPSALKKENNIIKAPKEDLSKKKIDEEAIKEIKKKLEAKRERIKMNAELRKRKQVLLEKQLNQQKLLIERLESGNVKGDQKNTIMSTIKSLQESIEKLKKDLAQDVEASLSSIQTTKKPALPPTPLEVFRKTKEETQRELLDAELDLLKQEQQGKEVVELKKKISDLKLKAFQLKLPPIFKPATPPYPPATRGRGVATFKTRRGAVSVMRGRGGGTSGPGRFTYTSLEYNVIDHRPTKLLVSGYEQDDKAEVLTHFNQFGEILNYTSDDATPSLVLNYKSRKEAEAALAKGKNFQDRLLSVTWATPNHNIRPGITTHNSQVIPDEDMTDDVLVSAEEEDEMVGLLSPSESLILQDEEEDDEEDRTWRR